MIKVTLQQGPKATPKQITFIAILTGDLGFNRHTRNAHISNILEREIHFLDELYLAEAFKIIDIFKEWKDKQYQRS